MVILKYDGDGETFFHYKGTKYKTKDYEVTVPEEVAEWLMTNPKWSKTTKATIKSKKKPKKEAEDGIKQNI